MNKSYLYHFVAIFTVIIWGTTFVTTKILLNNGLTPTQIFFYRFLLAYIGICFFAPKILFSKSIKDELRFVAMGLCGGSIYFYTENTALGITLVSNVALIVSSAPLITALLSYLINRSREESLSKNLIMGSLMAIIGVALVVFNGRFILKLNPLGDFLSIVAALSWACYSLMLKRIESKYPVTFITRKVFFYGILTILPFFFFDSVKPDFKALLNFDILKNILFLGLIASLACFVMWSNAIKKLGLLRVTNYIYFVPMITFITSTIVLNEKMTLVAILGSALILLGVYVAENGIGTKFLKLNKTAKED